MRKFLIVLFCFFMTYAHCATLEPSVQLLCNNLVDREEYTSVDDSCKKTITSNRPDLYSLTTTTECWVDWDTLKCSHRVSSYKCQSDKYGTADCQQSTSSAYQYICTGCNDCPANATCYGTSSFSCNTNYYKSGSSCNKCPDDKDTYDKCNNDDGLVCAANHYKSGTTCIKCPSYKYENVIVSGNSAAGTTNISGCYITAADPEKPLEDEVGWFYYSGKSCYHTAQDNTKDQDDPSGDWTLQFSQTSPN